jgi:hypothetical protein
MENYLMEVVNMKQGFLPVDLNTAANTGARCSIKNCKRIAFVVQMGDSTGAVVQATFNQHNAASGGTSKVLAHANPYYTKAGAATSFTKVSPSSASTFDISTDFAAQEGIAVFEVLAEDLDVEGDFAWVSLSIADTTAAKIGACLVMFLGPDNNPPYGQAV